MQSGKLITFEGLDGCGKSTQLEKATKWLTLQGCEVLKTQQPGGTRIGKQIRNILLNPDHKELHPESELLLYLSDGFSILQKRSFLLKLKEKWYCVTAFMIQLWLTRDMAGA